MVNLVILGSSNAVPDARHENTHFALVSEEETILIDCPGNPVVRLQQAGLDHHQIKNMVLTHFHPDHVSGAPSLLMSMWLLGRQEAVQVHGLGHTLDRLQQMMDGYEWKKWPGFFPVGFNPLPAEEMAFVLENKDVRIYASPVKHIIPTVGLRIEFIQSGKVVAYSCDTEPCDAVVNLARGADVLIHECSGASYGHSSAAQSGEIATRAGVKALYLIHYPTGGFNYSKLADEARTSFTGDVYITEDFMQLKF